MKKALIFILFTLFFYTVGAFGQEKNFPTSPINVYIGYPPGGGTAIAMQILAEGMKKVLNQNVVVNFKPGAASTIAADFVSKSRPDGYTLYYTSDPDLLLSLILEGSNLKFTMDDFVSLGGTPNNIMVLVVRDESPWKSLEDFMDFGRKSPKGTLTVGGSGLNNSAHMNMELFSRRTGVPYTYIPFQGGGPADTALLGGHISGAVGSIGRYTQRLRPGGGLRALCFFHRKRHPNYPDVPTMLEKGYDIAIWSWQGLHAPKGLPIGAKTTLVQAFEKTARDPQIVSIMAKEGFEPIYFSPEEMDKQNKSDHILFQDLLKTSGISTK